MSNIETKWNARAYRSFGGRIATLSASRCLQCCAAGFTPNAKEANPGNDDAERSLVSRLLPPHLRRPPQQQCYRREQGQRHQAGDDEDGFDADAVEDDASADRNGDHAE